MTRIPAATTLLLLLSGLCHGDVTGATNTFTTASAPTALSTTKISVSTPNSTNGITEPTTETSPKGRTDSSTPGESPVTSSTASGSAGNTIPDVISNESVTTEDTVTSPSLSSTFLTLQSSPNMTENQTSIKTTEISVSTQQPSPSPSEVTASLSTLTTSRNTSQSQGVILPVVIVLIVITLSVFVLVGLYRMCWKNDPGTPENGSDQPQSDKESVKLLTVKTISHESGEHCVAGKTKN
ncbi:endomucin isoform X2 [Heterocephalus glaber]|uniref:Endomucin isoform X2 n=1 Tax=Heterocephalus glaber TaxID=10181 RepID=A0AAX6RXY1_HETGA|nr:endomucin isoform X2 [Heterocephalus glaber]